MMHRNPKISIIVPVYKVEKYLGYCLNSILSQTYTNWQAILVDDGSPDGSLAICQQYQRLDSRFVVYSKENGGVSSARNYGLQFADGDYLEFLDSDDSLSQDALEKQVAMAQKFHSSLVVTDVLMVDYSAPNNPRTQLTSDWLGESPCCLSAAEFREKEMRLIWFTALLEGPYSKLYDATLWRQLGLTFPEELSLGEDFVTNMKFYRACERIVFLKEPCHYYNCITGSDSLTHKYRPDLFEVKMYLMQVLNDHLGGWENLSPEELDAFSCYVASTGLRCVEDAVQNSNLEPEQLEKRVGEMLDHKLFYESLSRAGYIPEQFQSCVPYLRSKDAQKGIAVLRGEQIIDQPEPEHEPEPEETPSAENALAVPPLPQNPGILNRGIRKLLRWAQKGSRDPWLERLTRWESEILERGLKYTLRRHRQDHKQVTRNVFDRQIALTQQMIQEADRSASERAELAALLEKQSNLILAQGDRIHGEVNARVYGIFNQLEEQLPALNAQYQALDSRLEVLYEEIGAAQTGLRSLEAHLEAQEQTADNRLEALYEEINAVQTGLQSLEARLEALEQTTDHRWETVREELGTMAQSFSRQLEDRCASADQKLAETAGMLKKEVNDYTWLSEQRMSRNAYRREITDLRQRRKAILVASAEHSNIGDAAITLAEQDFLLKYYPEYDQVEISTYEFSQKEAFLHAILNAEDILFISGGGNIGDMYPAEEELHRKIVAEFPNNRIIIFPQTISFSWTARGAAELAKSARIYNHHKHLRLYVRGNSSLEVARTHFPGVESRLMPDMVHMLKTDYAFSRKGALLCLREDQEGILDGGQKAELEQTLLDAVGTVDRRTNMHTQDIPREDRGLVVRQELMHFASHKIAVTDRLHGMIFSAITGTPCVVLPSCNHKIREYYEAFFRDAEGIFLADSPEDIRPVIQKALAIEHAHCPILDQEPHGTMRSE